MSWIVLDCPSGISGDMTLGALVDLGVPLEELRAALATLPLEGWALRTERVLRSSIAATRVHVDLIESAAHVHGHEHAHGHAHEHGHSHPHEHGHEHAASSSHADPEPHRHLGDILSILQSGKLSPRALGWATEVFRKLAAAEAKVHRMPIESVHFHEVGAVDAIVDIAAACVGLDLLCKRHDADEIRVSQLRVGRGQVRTDHGVMAVPPPAVLELLEGFPVQWSPTDGERVTPTGAALVTTLARPLGDAVVAIRSTGYGAGAKEFPDVPNVLRILLVDPIGAKTPVAAAPSPGRPSAAKPVASKSTPASLQRNQVAVLSTTLDDMLPEFFGHLMTLLFTAGALDVQYTPVQMKKARPATLVTVIARPEDAERLAALVLNESPTLGVRIAYEERLELERRLAEVVTPYGRVQVKIATRPDGGSRTVPEYESVRALAESCRVPIDEIYRAALLATPEPSRD